jgi:hypothetical protein
VQDLIREVIKSRKPIIVWNWSVLDLAKCESL